MTRSTSNSSASAVGSAAFRFYTIALSGGGKFALPDLAHVHDPTYQKTWLSYDGPDYDLEAI